MTVLKGRYYESVVTKTVLEWVSEIVRRFQSRLQRINCIILFIMHGADFR